MTTTEHLNPSAKPISRTRGMRALAVLGAAGLAHTVWAVAVPLAGTELTVRTNGGTQHLGWDAVLAASLFAGLAAWALLAALERFTSKACRIWTITTVAVLALSLAGPLTSGTGAATTLTLTAMHLAVGAALIPTMRRSTC